MKFNVRFALLGTLGVIALALLAWNLRSEPVSSDELASLGVVVLPEPISIEDLRLVDEDGEAFDGSELEGKWTFGFFGYTHCPDICPITLAQMKTVFDEFKEQGDVNTLENTQRLFVSIDAKRDHHEAVKSYTDNIDPDIIGITGEPDEVKRLADSVFVGYKQLGDPEKETDYLVEHQGNIVIFDRDGNCYGFIKSPFEEHLLARIFSHMATLS